VTTWCRIFLFVILFGLSMGLRGISCLSPHP